VKIFIISESHKPRTLFGSRVSRMVASGKADKNNGCEISIAKNCISIFGQKNYFLEYHGRQQRGPVPPGFLYMIQV